MSSRKLSNDEIRDIAFKIYEAMYDEEETDYYLELLQKETGLLNFSDYIFWPDEVGLDLNAEFPEIIAKIFEDMKR